MSDAPERLWLDWKPGLAVTQGPLACPPRAEYIRADLSDALVAELAEARDLAGKMELDTELLRLELAEAREALERIDQWSRAYPTKVFPKPDLARAAKVLSDAGMSLDVISADTMRHATEGVGKIARNALEGDDT